MYKAPAAAGRAAARAGGPSVSAVPGLVAVVRSNSRVIYKLYIQGNITNIYIYIYMLYLYFFLFVCFLVAVVSNDKLYNYIVVLISCIHLYRVTTNYELLPPKYS